MRKWLTRVAVSAADYDDDDDDDDDDGQDSDPVAELRKCLFYSNVL